MDVTIEKAHGNITISTGMLSYSCDTIIGGDSKITRIGQWNMTPAGTLVMVDDNETHAQINIDAHMVVQNDIIRVYTKDDSGNWVLVSETTMNETPNSDLSFSLFDATI